MPATDPLFRSDPYARSCTARVVAVTEEGGVILDRSVFYPLCAPPAYVTHVPLDRRCLTCRSKKKVENFPI